jgi:hypothetical protein
MWKEIKQQVADSCPDLNPQGTDFYQVVLGEFINQTKCASEDELLAYLFEDGVVSRQGIYAYQNEKLASPDDDSGGRNTPPKPGLDWGSVVRQGFGGALATAGAAGIIYGAGHLGRKLYQKSVRNKRLNEIYKFHPEVRSMDKNLVNATMKDIERFNPSAAASPLVAGSIIKDIDLNRGQFDVDKAKSISDIKDRGEDTLHQVMESGSAGFGEYGKESFKKFGPNRVKKQASDNEFVSSKNFFKK